MATGASLKWLVISVTNWSDCIIKAEYNEDADQKQQLCLSDCVDARAHLSHCCSNMAKPCVLMMHLISFELVYEKTCFLQMQKQRHRSAAQ